MAKPKRVIIDGDGVWTRLAKKYSSEAGWALLNEVRNKTGYAGAERYADAIAMNCWPSRGMELHGFEIKVDRGDVLRELKNPAKSDGIQRYCDRWWLVLAGEEIIKPGELPVTWGLQVPKGKDGLKVLVEAPKLEPAPLDRRFVASVLRNFHERYVARRELVEERQAVHREMEEKVAERLASRIDQETASVRNAHSQLLDAVTKFKEETGIDILGERYDMRGVGKAIQALKMLKLQPRYGLDRVTDLVGDLEQATKIVRDVAAELAALIQPETDSQERAA